MSIRVSVEPYCQNCPEFSPELFKNTLRDEQGRCVCSDTTIFCEHREKCSRMYDSIKEGVSDERTQMHSMQTRQT